MGKRMDDALDAWRQGSRLREGENARGSFARGDQMFWTTLYRGRVGTFIALLAASGLTVLLILMFR